MHDELPVDENALSLLEELSRVARELTSGTLKNVVVGSTKGAGGEHDKESGAIRKLDADQNRLTVSGREKDLRGIVSIFRDGEKPWNLGITSGEIYASRIVSK